MIHTDEESEYAKGVYSLWERLHNMAERKEQEINGPPDPDIGRDLSQITLKMHEILGAKQLALMSLPPREPFTLVDFIRESNRIEGIQDISEDDITVHDWLLGLKTLCTADLEKFVHTIAEAELRVRDDMNVRVGHHKPPRGSAMMRHWVQQIIDNEDQLSPWAQHKEYETLHPFMDGNGRSGRALWLWRMGGIENVPLGFLHTNYYQGLSEQR